MHQPPVRSSSMPANAVSSPMGRRKAGGAWSATLRCSTGLSKQGCIKINGRPTPAPLTFQVLLSLLKGEALCVWGGGEKGCARSPKRAKHQSESMCRACTSPPPSHRGIASERSQARTLHLSYPCPKHAPALAQDWGWCVETQPCTTAGAGDSVGPPRTTILGN